MSLAMTDEQVSACAVELERLKQAQRGQFKKVMSGAKLSADEYDEITNDVLGVYLAVMKLCVAYIENPARKPVLLKGLSGVMRLERDLTPELAALIAYDVRERAGALLFPVDVMDELNNGEPVTFKFRAPANYGAANKGAE